MTQVEVMAQRPTDRSPLENRGRGGGNEFIMFRCPDLQRSPDLQRVCVCV